MGFRLFPRSRLATGQPAGAAPGPRAGTFWPTAWLIVALVVVKATYVQLSAYWNGLHLVDLLWVFLGWVAAASQQDVLFGLAVGLLAAAAAFALRTRPAWTTGIVRLQLALGAACLVWAVASRQLFAYYFAPVTWQLMSLGGEPSRLWSSLKDFVSVPVVVALLGLPLLYVWLSHATARRAGRWSAVTGRRVRLSLAALLLAWLAGGLVMRDSNWFVAQERHFPESPHWVLLQSMTMGSSAASGLGAVAVRADDLAELSQRADSAPRPASAQLPGTGGAARPRNIVLIVMESVGAHYLSLYGSHYDTTPNLLAERQNALVFTNYYAPVGWTAYSLIALVLSQRPPMERYNEVSFRIDPVAAGSLAKSLASAGYRTAFMSSGDPNWASPGFLERQGFNEIHRGQDLPGAKAISSWGTQDRFLFDSILGWVDQRRNEPFFVMAWTDQTHQPYTVAPDQTLVPFRTSGRNAEPLARYLGLVRETDAQIERLLQGLRDRGLADDTLVVITGDHGESFGESHGGSGHGFSVYDDEVHVPLVLWNPRLFGGGSHTSDVLGTHVDLAPTLLDIVGLPSPGAWDGRSLFDATRSPHAYLFAAAWGQYLLGVRDRNLKYSFDARTGHEELFDLATDPDEQHNIAGTQPVLAVRERERLAALLKDEQARSEVRKARLQKQP
jgi:arylsulfatase A-like enzyme